MSRVGWLVLAGVGVLALLASRRAKPTLEQQQAARAAGFIQQKQAEIRRWGAGPGGRWGLLN